MPQRIPHTTPLALASLVLVSCTEVPAEPETGVGAPPNPALAVAPNSWITRANVPGTERLGLTSAVVPNAAGQSVLYVIGGSSSLSAQPPGPTSGALARVQAYNAATNTWTSKAPLPLALYKTNGTGVIDGKIYVSGGRMSGDKNYQHVLLVYDPATNTWTRRRDMPEESWGGVTGVINNQLYVLTCLVQEDCDQFAGLTLFRYDPPSDQWTVLSHTDVPLGRPMGGVIGGKLYATGGPDGALLAYDPATNQWTTKRSLPRPRWSAAGVALAGKLYVLGGFQAEPGRDQETGSPHERV